MKKYSIDNFRKGDVVSVTQNENAKDITYIGTITELFKSAINSGIVRIVSKNFQYGFKDIGVIWIKKAEIHGNKYDGDNVYKCTKGMLLEKCDDDGFTLENEYCDIEVNSIWHTPEDKDYRFIGGEVRLESDEYGWIEITKDDLREHFEEI